MSKKKQTTPVVFECAIDENRDNPGIHCIDPDVFRLEQAKEKALRDNFSTIYLHFSNVVSFNQNKRKKVA